MTKHKTEYYKISAVKCKNLTTRNRKPIYYKITKPQLETALELLKKNEQLNMNELVFDITHKHLVSDIRDRNSYNSTYNFIIITKSLTYTMFWSF